MSVSGELLLTQISYYFNFERNYDVSKSKSPCIFLNKNINFNKNETRSKMKIPQTVLERRTLCFSSYKNRKLKSKLLELARKFFLTFVSVLNTLSDYTYFYISKKITSYTFLLVFKIVESLQCILKVSH